MVVAINKMDMTSPPWDESRFLAIQSHVHSLLAELHFPPTAVITVPLSGLSGVNVMSPPGEGDEGAALRTWYSGPSLMQALDLVEVPAREVGASLRAIITSVEDGGSGGHASPSVGVKSAGGGGGGADVTLSMLVYRGRVRRGRRVSLPSIGSVGTVKHIITSAGVPVDELPAGMHGLVSLVDRWGGNNDCPPLSLSCRHFVVPNPCHIYSSPLFDSSLVKIVFCLICTSFLHL